MQYFLVLMQIIFYLVATANYGLQIKSTMESNSYMRIQSQKVF